jgi:hypothetical protein
MLCSWMVSKCCEGKITISGKVSYKKQGRKPDKLSFRASGRTQPIELLRLSYLRMIRILAYSKKSQW